MPSPRRVRHGPQTEDVSYRGVLPTGGSHLKMTPNSLIPMHGMTRMQSCMSQKKTGGKQQLHPHRKRSRLCTFLNTDMKSKKCSICNSERTAEAIAFSDGKHKQSKEPAKFAKVEPRVEPRVIVEQPTPLAAQSLEISLSATMPCVTWSTKSPRAASCRLCWRRRESWEMPMTSP